MTEQALEQALDETTDFVQRQRLLKQLWKLHQQPVEHENALRSTPKLQSRYSRDGVKSQQADSFVL